MVWDGQLSQVLFLETAREWKEILWNLTSSSMIPQNLYFDHPFPAVKSPVLYHLREGNCLYLNKLGWQLLNEMNRPGQISSVLASRPRIHLFLFSFKAYIISIPILTCAEFKKIKLSVSQNCKSLLFIWTVSLPTLSLLQEYQQQRKAARTAGKY